MRAPDRDCGLRSAKIDGMRVMKSSVYGRIIIALIRIKGTTWSEIETAGSGKIWVSGFGPWESAAGTVFYDGTRMGLCL